jgi:hypothetical protein
MPPSAARGQQQPVVTREMRRRALLAVARSLAVTAALGLVYFLAPMRDAVHDGIPLLVLSLVALAALLGWHLRAIGRSAHPSLRAVEAVSTSVPFLVLTFAAAYYMMARSTAGAFGGPLTRLDALYFSVTAFTTVGFGDIAARSQLARGVVTAQMLIDFVFVGVAVRVLFGIAKYSRDLSRG